MPRIRTTLLSLIASTSLLADPNGKVRKGLLRLTLEQGGTAGG